MLQFAKYEAAGNDFIVLSRMEGGVELQVPDARWLCDRHLGVGADGVLVVLREPGHDARMQLINADGSLAAMCGNGLRVVAKWLHDSGLVADERSSLTVASGAGVYGCTRLTRGRYRVQLGRARFEHDDLPHTHDGLFEFTVAEWRGAGSCVHFGNPHLVVFSDDETPRVLCERYGASLESHPAFPQRVNVSFARRGKEPGHLVAAVHERGVGLTLSCGSGACAIATAAVRQGLADFDAPVFVELPGGCLEVAVGQAFDVVLEGDVRRVFVGEVELP